MRTCQHCGATLADSAQYCMQCGTPAEGGQDAPTPPPSVGTFLAPAFLSGSLAGILGSIPVVNCLCCVWMLGGGAFAAWLTGRNTTGGMQGLTYGDGAFAGALAGLWAAIVATLASIPLTLLTAGEEQRAELETMINEYPEISGPLREFLLSVASGDVTPAFVLAGLVINVLIYGLFAMIGGIILIAILKRPSATRPPVA